jgi:hypothetical protein
MASIKRTRGPIAPGDRKQSPFDRSRIGAYIIDSSLKFNSRFDESTIVLDSLSESQETQGFDG